MKSNICFQQNTSQSLNQYLWIYLGSPALLRYFENQCHFNCTQLFSYSWSSFSMLRFLVIRLWCAATRSSCIEINWAQYKKLRNNFNLHYNTILKGHIISPWVEHTLGAKLPPALSCWGVRHQAPPHLMLPLASKDVLHFSTPKKNQLLQCGISISISIKVYRSVDSWSVTFAIRSNFQE